MTVACVASPGGESAQSIPPIMTSASITTLPVLDTGDLAEPEVRRIRVGDTPLVVAWADEPQTRARGLMEVETLGDLHGMLFDLGEERVPRFTMRNTLIPLDIYFYDDAGEPVGMRQMIPCEAEPCPTYTNEVPARFALEVPAGHALDDKGVLHID